MIELLHASDVAREAGDLTAAGVRAAENRGEIDAIRTPSGVRVFTRDATDRFLARRAEARREKSAARGR